MSIKKIISGVISLFLMVSMLAVMPAGVSAEASEKDQKNWSTLVLICRRVDIPNGLYNTHGVTQMYDSEVNRIKNDAVKLEETINSWSANKANMKIDVQVNDIPIKSMSNSSAYGHYIDPVNVEEAINKYAPKGKYDSIVVVYRDKDYSTSLSTKNHSSYSLYSANGATFSTVALQDKDHSMNFDDPNYPMYLLEPLAQGLYSYYKNYGFDLEYPEVIYTGGDKEQFNKFKRDYYKCYLEGSKYSNSSKVGITKEMWTQLPTSKIK